MRASWRARARSLGTAAAWALAAVLSFWPLGAEELDPRPASLAARLLGPIGSLAASLQWVRFDAALDRARPDLAYARAELALELDPRATEGWSYLANHLVFERGSAAVEPDASRRVRSMRAGLALLERGEQEAREPERLAMDRGLMLVAIGDSEWAPLWPGGPAAAYEEAARAFRRATELGDPRGSELADLAALAAERSDR